MTAYFAAVHVDMGKHGIGGVQRPRVRRVLVGPRAHQQDKIGLLKDGPLMASGRTGARWRWRARRARAGAVRPRLPRPSPWSPPAGRNVPEARQGPRTPRRGARRRPRRSRGFTAGKADVLATPRTASRGGMTGSKRTMAERDAPLFGLRRHTEHVVGEQEHDGDRAARNRPPRRPDPRSPPRGPPYVPASSTWSRPRTDGHGRIPETHCDPHSSTGSPEA